MDDYKEKTDSLFRERLADFEQSPPDASWDKISDRLAQKKKNSVGAILFRIAAGMAILISSSLLVYYFTQPGDSNKGSEYSAISDNTHASANLSVIKPDTLLTNSDNENKITGSQKPSDQFIRNADLLQKGINSSKVQNSYDQIILTENSTSGKISNDESNLLPENQVHEETNTFGDQIFPLQYSRIESRTFVSENEIDKLQLKNSPVNENQPVKPPSELSESEMVAILLSDYTNETEPVKEKKHRWLIGSEVAPLYSHRDINSDYLQSDMIDNLNENESGILAYAGGIRISYSTNKRLSVQSGLYYSRYGQEKNQVETINALVEANTQYAVDDNQTITVTNSTGEISGEVNDIGGSNRAVSNDLGQASKISYMGLMSSNVEETGQEEEVNVTLKQYFDYVEVPVILKYKIIDRKLDFSFSGGLVTNFLIGNSVDLIKDGEASSIGKTRDINNINYLGSIGMGLEYNVISNVALTLEPRFRYYINPIDKSSQISVHPFSFGLFAGFNYRF